MTTSHLKGKNIRQIFCEAKEEVWFDPFSTCLLILYWLKIRIISWKEKKGYQIKLL